MKKHLLVKAIFCLLIFASCKSAMGNEESRYSSLDGVSDTDFVTPYADMNLLENARCATATDPDVVNWKVARFFAVMEKVEFEKQYESWKGAKVSEKPIIIYYANSEKPKFYEFRVIKGNTEVGSITCNASKKEGKPVAYVSEMTHKVLGKVAKDLATYTDSARLTVVNYPNSFVVEKSNANAISTEGIKGEFKDALTYEKIDASKVFVEERVDVMLEKADAKTLAELEITMAERDEMLREIREQQEITSQMWQDIDSFENEMIAMSDEEIENRMHSDSIATRKVESSETNTIYRNFLYDWYNKREWYRPGGLGCGPAALGFITLGLGKKSGLKDVPLTSDYEKNTAVYMTFQDEIGSGPRLISTLDSAMRKYTNYKVERLRSHRWSDVNNHFLNYKLPVISLRSGWYGNYAGYHYRTIIGVATCCTTENHVRWWWWFGWHSRRWTKEYYNDWYYMHDAGVDTYGWYNYCVEGDAKYGNFWERSGLPCQRRLGLVKHK